LVTVKPGQWVTSTAGRDQGTHYLVIAVENERTLYVADGLRRSVASPKRKNVRHVWVHDAVHEGLASQLRAGKKLQDSDVRTALMELMRKEEEVG